MTKDNNDSTQDPVSAKLKKVLKTLKENPDFVEEANAMSTDDLKKVIFTCNGNLYTIEKEKSEDVKLSAAKEVVKEFSQLYSPGIKMQKAKIEYALYLLEEKGVSLSS